MKKIIIEKLLISIKDISGGKGEAFVAILHDYKNAKVMGKDMEELLSGIKATTQYCKQKNIKNIAKKEFPI